jgi:glycosyltransferase involved in cell wall biosynthesis
VHRAGKLGAGISATGTNRKYSLIALLILARQFGEGGAERQLLALLRGLDKQKFSLTVATFYPGGALSPELNAIDSLRAVPLNKLGPWDILGFARRLARLIREVEPDIIYGYAGPANVIALLFGKLRGAKVLWAIRASKWDPSRYGLPGQLSFWLERRLARYADRIIANSEAGRDYARRLGFPLSRLAVIENGIDSDRFRPDPAGRERIRTGWHVEHGQRLIGLIARLDPDKDHPTFLKAAAKLTRANVHIRFVCVGDGPSPYRERLRRLAADLGLETVLIWSRDGSDLPAIYNALNIVVNCSTSEGFSNVIGEAMSCGIPCVVTDVGDSARIVGSAGEVVPPSDPVALAAGIMRMLARVEAGDLADTERRIQVNRERIRRLYPLDRMIGETERLLCEIAKS